MEAAGNKGSAQWRESVIRFLRWFVIPPLAPVNWALRVVAEGGKLQIHHGLSSGGREKEFGVEG